ncbi:MAG: hypothetical protein FWE88_04905 [Phycisphaerae bacterium]|nr:hypothetical protein [Phycisphaerae bacterium]
MNKLMVLLAAAGMLMSAGCFSFRAEAPELVVGSPPPDRVHQADPNDKSDVIRENQELHARNAWLERQVEGRQKKHKELLRDQDNIQADIKRTQRETERYR